MPELLDTFDENGNKTETIIKAPSPAKNFFNISNSPISEAMYL